MLFEILLLSICVGFNLALHCISFYVPTASLLKVVANGFLRPVCILIIQKGFCVELLKCWRVFFKSSFWQAHIFRKFYHEIFIQIALKLYYLALRIPFIIRKEILSDGLNHISNAFVHPFYCVFRCSDRKSPGVASFYILKSRDLASETKIFGVKWRKLKLTYCNIIYKAFSKSPY